MQDKYYNITIALAGILQAVALIRELTQTGKTDELAFHTSIQSILETDPKDVFSVFHGLEGLKLGLTKVAETFDSSGEPDRLQSRYLLSLIHLQKKLTRSPYVLNVLTKRLKQIQKQIEYFSSINPTVITNLADIYLQTISTFKFRIIILGNQRILKAGENMDKIRALLLAGVRSAVLWQQMGGSRFQLLFSRAKIKDTAEKILLELQQHQKDSI